MLTRTNKRSNTVMMRSLGEEAFKEGEQQYVINAAGDSHEYPLATMASLKANGNPSAAADTGALIDVRQQQQQRGASSKTAHANHAGPSKKRGNVCESTHQYGTRMSKKHKNQLLDRSNEETSTTSTSTSTSITTTEEEEEAVVQAKPEDNDKLECLIHAAEWNFHFELLCVFHRDYGHCRFPDAYVVESALGVQVKLGKFASEQREDYHRLKQGDTDGVWMTQKQIDRLNSVDFDWNYGRVVRANTPEPVAEKNKAIEVELASSEQDMPAKETEPPIAEENDAAAVVHFDSEPAAKNDEPAATFNSKSAEKNVEPASKFDSKPAAKKVQPAPTPAVKKVAPAPAATKVQTAPAPAPTAKKVAPAPAATAKKVAPAPAPQAAKKVAPAPAPAPTAKKAQTAPAPQAAKKIAPAATPTAKKNVGAPVAKKVATASAAKEDPAVAKEKEWKRKFELLCDFKRQNGHCRVPQAHVVESSDGSPPVKLGMWVVNNRIAYKNFNRKSTGSASITKKQIGQLNSIGFEWTCKQPMLTQTEPVVKNDAAAKEKAWKENFELLRTYQRKHGHCRVPDRYVIDGVKLGKWVHSQLHYYRNFNPEERGPNQDTAKKRVDLLNSIGFDWRRRKPPRAKPRFVKRRSPGDAEEIKEPSQQPTLPRLQQPPLPLPRQPTLPRLQQPPLPLPQQPTLRPLPPPPPPAPPQARPMEKMHPAPPYGYYYYVYY